MTKIGRTRTKRDGEKYEASSALYRKSYACHSDKIDLRDHWQYRLSFNSTRKQTLVITTHSEVFQYERALGLTPGVLCLNRKSIVLNVSTTASYLEVDLNCQYFYREGHRIMTGWRRRPLAFCSPSIPSLILLLSLCNLFYISLRNHNSKLTQSAPSYSECDCIYPRSYSF